MHEACMVIAFQPGTAVIATLVQHHAQSADHLGELRVRYTGRVHGNVQRPTQGRVAAISWRSHHPCPPWAASCSASI
jgi:hypothetical protein